MSASREKKQRQQPDGQSEKQRQKTMEERKAKTTRSIYVAVGLVAAVAIAALLVWHSGIIQKNSTAVTIGGEKYTVADLDYYYRSLANMYAQYGITIDDETRKSLVESAVSTMQNTVILAKEAGKAGYSLSEESKQNIETQLKQIDSAAAQYGYSRTAYLKLLYGKYFTESLFRKHMSLSALASEYSTYFSEQQQYTDADLETYYKEHANELDTYDYRVAFIDGTVPAKTAEDGSTVEPTEEEKASALAAAKAKADQMLAKINAGAAFNETAAQYVSAESAAYYTETPDYNRISGKVGTEIASGYSAWFAGETARKAGEAGIQDASTGYYVLSLISRNRSQNTYGTVDVRHILVKAETTPATDGSAAKPTEAQLAAAKQKADDILAEWKAGAATAESFAQLANLKSEDPGSNTNGGLYAEVTRGQMIPSFNDWCFAAGRNAGDTGIVENTSGSSADVLGYHVMYLDKLGELRWKYMAREALVSDAYDDWYESVKPGYEAVTSESGLALVK